ncbi:MAG: hypothetical protein IKP95_00750 [Ruminococcus sp.]|nr:hypothetical protein [Ruminococcus sp.]
MLPITILDESILPKGAINVFNVIVLLYVAGLTPLLIWRAYKHNKKRDAEQPAVQAAEQLPQEQEAPPVRVKRSKKRSGRK